MAPTVTQTAVEMMLTTIEFVKAVIDLANLRIHWLERHDRRNDEDEGVV